MLLQDREDEASESYDAAVTPTYRDNKRQRKSAALVRVPFARTGTEADIAPELGGKLVSRF